MKNVHLKNKKMQIELNISQYSFVVGVKLVRDTNFSLYHKGDLYVSKILKASNFETGDTIKIFRYGHLFDEAVINRKRFVGFYKLKPTFFFGECLKKRTSHLKEIEISDFFMQYGDLGLPVYHGDSIIINSSSTDENEFIRKKLHCHSYNT